MYHIYNKKATDLLQKGDTEKKLPVANLDVFRHNKL